MSSMIITLQDSLDYTVLILTIIIGGLCASYFYLFFESFRSPAYSPVAVVDKPSIESPIKIQPLPSFHPEHIPDEIKVTGLIPFLRKKHLKYGWIVSDLPLENTLSVIDPIAIRSSFFLGNRPKNLYQFLEPIWGKDNFHVFGAERADKYRKFFGPALASDVIIDKFHDIRSIGLGIIDRWEKDIFLKHENVVRMQDQGLEFSLKATIKALFGTDLPRGLDLTNYKKAYDDVIGGLFDKQFGVLSDLREERIQNSLKYLFEVLYALIDEKKRGIAISNTIKVTNDPKLPPPRKDLLDLLISEKDPETERKFQDEKIRNIMSMFLTSGYLTTGVAISWTIFCITQDKDVQAKIQDEIDYVLKGRLPLYSDLLNLDYLTQVIKESLRVCPPIPFLSRYLEKNASLETTDNPLNLKAGTVILYPVTSIHEDEHILRNSKKFDPSRFSLDQVKMPFSHCPFGFGKRNCPAEKLAMVEIKLMICLIMQRFHVELGMSLNKVSRDEKFILMARNDIYIKLIPRKGVEE